MRLLTIAFFLVSVTQAIAIDVKSVFEATRPSVLLIVAYDENDQPTGMGSGFFFGDTKTIATNLHVVQNAAKLAIKLSSGETGWIDTVLGVDAERDLALLQSNVTGTPIKAAGRLPDIGEDILAIGNPSGLEGTVSTGIISGIRTEDGSQYFQITAPISPGSSGGPIIDQHNEVLGVSTFYLDGAQSLNFAMPAAYLTKLYSKKSEATLAALKSSTNSALKRVEGNVKIMFAEMEYYPGDFSDLMLSVVNKSGNLIKNIKIVVNYFGSNKETPIHHSLHNLKEEVPPNLSLRLKRKVQNASEVWTPIVTILDYEIVSGGSSGQLLKFD
ncbi:serine protease [Planktomarina temperata]|nr:serine protease [Planktomarina temperata]